MTARDRLAGIVNPDLLELVDAYVDERVSDALEARLSQETNGARWLSLPQAAELLDCSVDAVRMRVKRGRLEARKEGRRLYVSRASVEPPLRRADQA